MEFLFPLQNTFSQTVTQHTAYLGRTEINLFYKKRKRDIEKILSIAENKEIFRKVVITRQEKCSFAVPPPLACPFEAGGLCPSMPGPGSLTGSISGSWRANSHQFDHPCHYQWGARPV